MNITLIYPGISWSGFGTFGSKNMSESNFINHGLASLEAYISMFGHKTEFIDLRMLKNWSDLRRVLRQSKNTIFGISSTTVDFGNTIKISKIIKKINSKNIVIVGGVHPTIRPMEAIRVATFDYVVTGEGEIVLERLLSQLEKKFLPKKKLIVGEFCPLENIPHINRDLFFHRQGEMIYPFVSVLKAPSATILTSRGCPFNCNFCQPAERMTFGGKVRLREMSDVVAELVEIKQKYGLASFMIHDDLFIFSKDRIIEFVKLYKKSGLKAKFICQGRADLIIKYRDQMRQLGKAGLVGVMVGFESGSDRILKFLEKNTTVSQNIEAAAILKSFHIKTWANYMLGIPTETYGEMIQTLMMIKKINPEYLSPSLFTPYPETGLYDYCKKNKLLRIKKYDQYRRSLGGDKIGGINYTVVRLLIFLFLPFKSKVDSIVFLLKRLFL